MVLSGNQALDPAGLAPAIVTLDPGKVTVLGVKNSEYRDIANNRANINPTRAASTYLLQIFAGSDRPDPFVNQGLGCT